jgi:hypothetical protein
VDDTDIIASATGNTRIGPYWDVVQAPSFVDPDQPIIKVGLLDDSRRIAERTGTQIAQYTYIVRQGLVDAILLYRGVRRPMKFGSDMHADQKILIYVWRPPYDFQWVGGRQSRAFPEKRDALVGRVFVVLVRPYDKPDEHGVSGTILRWNWVYGNPMDGPIDGDDGMRYTGEVWRRPYVE